MSTTVGMPLVSREYLYLPGIKAFDDRSPDADADPTTLPVEVALITPGTDPVDDDWHAAAWFDAATARILIGQDGTITPTAGTWSIWLRVTGATEEPERQVGTMVIR